MSSLDVWSEFETCAKSTITSAESTIKQLTILLYVGKDLFEMQSHAQIDMDGGHEIELGTIEFETKTEEETIKKFILFN